MNKLVSGTNRNLKVLYDAETWWCDRTQLLTHQCDNDAEAGKRCITLSDWSMRHLILCLPVSKQKQ